MDVDRLAREVMDMRKTLDEAVREIERFVRAKSDTVSFLPPAPFAPTLEDFHSLVLAPLNNDKDDDGA